MSKINVENEKTFHNEIFESKLRNRVDSVYQISQYIYDDFEKIVKNSIKSNFTILEYGCGDKSRVEELSNYDTKNFSFDLSDYAVNQNKAQFKKTSFAVCDAHNLIYEDNFFDLVFGSSILHHLDLVKAIDELERVIKPNGLLVFLEPLGHNYFINKFRNKTPELRTEDEHPLLAEDIKVIMNKFDIRETKYYCLFPLVVYRIFKDTKVNLLYKIARIFDKIAFKFFPFLKKYAWIVILIGVKKAK